MAKRNRNSKKSKRNRRAKRAAKARPTIDIHAKTQAQQNSPLMQALKTTAAVEKPAVLPDDRERTTKVDVAVERVRVKRESDSRELREARMVSEATEANEGPDGVDKAAQADDWDEAFFRRGEELEKEQLESLAPVAEEVEADDDAQEAWSTSPVVLKRRARFQKLVGIVVAAAAAVVLLGVGTNLSAKEPKAAAGRQVTHATVTPQHTNVKAAHKVRAVADTKGKQVQDSPKSPKSVEATPKEQKANPLTIKEQTPDTKPSKVAPPTTGKDAQKQALALLNRGKMKQVVPVAKQAVAQHPDQALPYLYLGSALQDLGRRREAIDAYSQCVRHATHGPVSECRAMGGRK